MHRVLAEDADAIVKLQQENARLRAAAKALVEKLRAFGADGYPTYTQSHRIALQWEDELAALEREVEGGKQ